MFVNEGRSKEERKGGKMRRKNIRELREGREGINLARCSEKASVKM